MKKIPKPVAIEQKIVKAYYVDKNGKKQDIRKLELFDFLPGQTKK